MLEKPSRAPARSEGGRPAGSGVPCQRYRLAGDFALREIAGETVVVPVCGAVAQLGAIFVLNEVGSVIWKAIQQGTTGEALVLAVTAEFDVTTEEATADVEGFLASLLDAELIRACAGQEP